jgi:hypothetical protein
MPNIEFTKIHFMGVVFSVRTEGFDEAIGHSSLCKRAQNSMLLLFALHKLLRVSYVHARVISS